MREMIAAEQNNFARHEWGNDNTRHCKIRDAVYCCYQWAALPQPESDGSRSGCLLVIWESSVAMAHLLKIPMEAAGPLFFAAADFQDQINSGLRVYSIEAFKFMTVLVSIMLPYTNGFSYQFSMDDDDNKAAEAGLAKFPSTLSNGLRHLSVPIRNRTRHCGRGKRSHYYKGCGHDSNVSPIMRNNSFEASTCEQGSQMFQHTSIGDSEQRPFNSISSSLDGMSHNLNVDLRVATEMKQFYAWVRSVKLPSGIDLNAFDWENRHASNACVVSLPSTCTEPQTPWELGYSWAINEGNISTTLENLYRVRDDDEGPFIRHMTPKYISVSARAVRSQLLGKYEIGMDLFDVIIRRIKQDDDVLYSSVTNLRGRHFFESDFMASITAGAFDLTKSKLCDQLVASYTPYDLTKCKLLFFPALLQHRWVCYAWRLHDNVISVFDPSYGVPVPDSRVDTHEQVLYMLKIAMHTVVGPMFHGWQYGWTSATMRIISCPDTALAGWNRTGLMCALFCRCFDGVDLNPKLESVDFDAIASKLTIDIVQLKGNSGKVPRSLLQ